MLQPGDTMADFELDAHDGTTVRSRDLKGAPYLLFFYPKAATPG
jgi:peroxiredoxin Q/BCP